MHILMKNCHDAIPAILSFRVPFPPKGPGACFGELALMYNAPRAATVQCTSENGASVWALDREPFQIMLVSAQSKKIEQYEGFLGNVKLFEDLNKYELGMLSDMLESELFEGGEAILQQGDQVGFHVCFSRDFVVDTNTTVMHDVVHDRGVRVPGFVEDDGRFCVFIHLC